MNKLYEALEVCLNEIEKGADVDTLLFRYPELADELRPLLKASVKAREMAVPSPSQEAIQRNRARVLQHAAILREAKAAVISRRVWSVPLRRVLVTLMVVTMLFVSGTGLVRASSNTLPGDNLYPVKRTWEDLSLFFTFDSSEREALEIEHENERLHELHELFAEGRSASVDFSGYITRQAVDEWRVSGITVMISAQTRLPDQPVENGAAVRVKGQVQNDMSVIAERIELLPPGSRLPEVEDNELEDDDEQHEGLNQQNLEDAGTQSESDSLKVVESGKSQANNESISGSITSIENKFIVVNGISMDVSQAEISGTLKVGISLTAEGYYDTSGVFIVKKIEVKNDGGSSDDGSKSESDKKDGEYESESESDN